MTPPALPSGWVASQGANVTGAPLWVTSAVMPHTAPNDAFSTAPDNILDNRLDTPLLTASAFDPGISFQNNYNLESGRDGAVLEISSPNINGGAFTDITDPAVGGSVNPGYNSVISSAFQSPIAGRMAWSGNSGGYVSTQAFFGKAAFPLAHNVKVRFRLVSDNSGASEGWRIDTVSVPHNECPSPTPPNPTPSPTVTPTATPTATATATATATVPPTATPTPTDCPGVCGSPTPPPTATPTPSPTTTPLPAPAQALNISTRLRVETGDRIAIGGFIITGNEPKKVAIRGIGPSLSNFGLSDILADPTLELRGSDGALLTENDNWQDDPAQAAQLVALGLAPPDPEESGMVATLQPGAYTAILSGTNQTTGLGLVEIYDADPAAASQLANISTRGFVQAGDNVMIGGFILGQGDNSPAVAVRGIGPSLSQSGLSNVLPDPGLELRDGNGALLIANDNWQDDPFAAAQLTANGLAPADPLESGIFATLPPGLFTAILTGRNGGVGLGLVEIYTGLQAPTLIVTNTVDDAPGSLRQLLADAPSGSTIRFDPMLYGRRITLGIRLTIDKDIVISGFGPNHSSIERIDDLLLSVLEIASGHTVIIEGLTIRGGHARLAGGGIRNNGSTLTVNNCVVGPNTAAEFGGGIANGGGARLTIINSTVSHNGVTGEANSAGGGIDNAGTLELRNSTVSDNGVGSGIVLPGIAGGILNRGSMTMTNSTVSGNSVVGGGGGIVNTGPLTITNSTISGNRAFPGGFAGIMSSAGGISHSGTSPLTISNSTISGNSAPDRGGGISTSGPLAITHSTINDNDADESSGDIHNSGSLQISITILKAGSSGTTIFNSSGTVTSGGHNLSSDTGGGFLMATGDQINANPMLGNLQNNGGPTFTHALLPGSPAIDAGDPNFISPPFSDQRGPGYDRVINGRIDIGSFEVQPAATPTPTPELRH